MLWIISITLIHNPANIPLQQGLLYSTFLEKEITKLASKGNLFSGQTHLKGFLINLHIAVAEGTFMGMLSDLHNSEELCPVNLQAPDPMNMDLSF